MKQEAEREERKASRHEASLLYNMTFISQVKMSLVGEELAGPELNSFTDSEGDLKF